VVDVITLLYQKAQPQHYKRYTGRHRHGHNSVGYQSPTYTSWRGMIQRCTTKTNARWRQYGGNGIRVCDRWRTFTNFLKDMGTRPKGTTLGRKADRGHYVPGNTLWMTQAQQSAAKRLNHRYTYIQMRGRGILAAYDNKQLTVNEVRALGYELLLTGRSQ
jgi:hypothetical protein